MAAPDPAAWAVDDLSAAPALRRGTQALVSLLVRAFGLKVSGLEHVPERGPLLVAGNHVSNLDGPVLAVAIGPKRFLRGLGKIELYRVPVLGWYLKNAGTIPVERGKGDVGAMRAAIELLRGGGALGLFPEGTRSKTGKPGRPKAGVGFLAAMSGAPVLPARIVGTDRFPKTRPLEVRFGPPLRFSGEDRGRARCQEFAEQVMERVLKL